MIKTIDELKNYYQKNLFKEEYAVSENDPQWQYIKEFLPQDRSSKILDAGCGNGRYAKKLWELGYYNVFGVDILEHKELTQANFNYITASIEAIPFKSNFFDFVFSNAVLNHVDDPRISLKEFFRTLKPGGYLIFSVHTKFSLFTLWRIFKRMLNMKSVVHLRNVKFYAAKTYLKLLNQIGFKHVWTDGYKLSFFWIPMVEQFIKLANKLFGLSLKLSLFYKTFPATWFAKLRANFAYHAIIIVQKPV